MTDPKTSIENSADNKAPGAMISLRLTAEEAAILKETAKSRGESISQLVRDAALNGRTSNGPTPIVQYEHVAGIVAAGGGSTVFVGTKTVNSTTYRRA